MDLIKLPKEAKYSKYWNPATADYWKKFKAEQEKKFWQREEWWKPRNIIRYHKMYKKRPQRYWGKSYYDPYTAKYEEAKFHQKYGY